MLGNLVPTRWRRSHNITDPNKPAKYNAAITPYLQTASRKACTHPIRTIALVAILASAFYVNLLETGFFRPQTAANKVDFNALSAGTRRLHLGQDTAWQWQVEENGSPKVYRAREKELALVTLDFLDTGNASPKAVPSPQDFDVDGVDLNVLPPSENILSGLSSARSLVFSLPLDQAASFLEHSREISAEGGWETDSSASNDDDEEGEQKKWLMTMARTPAASGSGSMVEWAQNSWSAFLDLLKNAETLDIIIMTLGYLSMYLTFISLFLSMRRLGSNFWLGTTTLFSSAFAFLFGLLVTLKLGVPENVVLLSEGIPFLVVTVGFEKPIMLTQAVLSASVQAKNSAANGEGLTIQNAVQNAVQQAVRERGFEIVRDYAIEIAILCAGAASGIQGGLRQFCFLAAWTLFFDCILLFTFYTSILTIKLEINRIKRHVALRKALEEDGVSRRVAEKVASSNEWPNGNKLGDAGDNNNWINIFGRKARDSSVPRFKLLMVTGFIAINVANLCTMPFRGHRHHVPPVTTAGLSSVVSSPPQDPFKVAGNGLDFLHQEAHQSEQPLSVTVFNPIKYDLQYPSVHYAALSDDWTSVNGDFPQGLFQALGGRVVESLLKSFEDPVLSKWVISLLAISLVLNGYLFNAARWTIKDPGQDDTDREEAVTEAPKANGHVPSPIKTHKPVEEVAPPVSPTALDGSRKRTREECEAMLRAKQAPQLSDAELVDLAVRGKIPGYALEKTLEDKTRAVKIRRSLISRTPATADLTAKLERSLLPYENFDYDRVHGACCENVVGYMPLPLGVAGPMTIDGKSYFLPMATTEGVLVASTSRGAKAINAGGGCITVLTGDGMTRGPCIGFETLTRAAAAKVWLDSADGQKVMKDAFNSTSRFARLQSLKTSIAGTYVYVRFKTTTGDAMGMNMISKGVEKALGVMSTEAGFSDMAIISVSGNFCTDKKPAAINWIDGRGKSVVAEAIIPGDVVRDVLKSNVDALVELNISKNLIGSAMAGSIGGFNAHAANIVTAIFLATGQDPAQNVESSNCITVMKK